MIIDRGLFKIQGVAKFCSEKSRADFNKKNTINIIINLAPQMFRFRNTGCKKNLKNLFHY